MAGCWVATWSSWASAAPSAALGGMVAGWCSNPCAVLSSVHGTVQGAGRGFGVAGLDSPWQSGAIDILTLGRQGPGLPTLCPLLGYLKVSVVLFHPDTPSGCRYSFQWMPGMLPAESPTLPPQECLGPKGTTRVKFLPRGKSVSRDW